MRNTGTSGAGSRAILQRVTRGEALVLLPALSVAAYWTGGELALLILSVAVPVLFAVLAPLSRAEPSAPFVGNAGLATKAQLLSHLRHGLEEVAIHGYTTACLVVIFDDMDRLRQRHGRLAADRMLMRLGERLGASLRAGDLVAHLPEGGFAISLAPVRRLDLETVVQMAARLQSAACMPLVVEAVTVHPSVSVGFCLADRAPALRGETLLAAAQTAADEAARNGPMALRAYQPDMQGRRADRAELRAGLETALDEGQIRPWFQPQICTDTGAITGFEALARWHHPDRGIIAPADFLPVIENEGLSERLAEVILYGALSALTRWDKAGHRIPRVAINLSAPELRNPRLAENLKWELDRFGLSPDRLSIEVLESVVAASDEDVIVANLAQISALGCGIDLDDFGTGQAALANIRRFAVRRIKVDRCFVTRCDTDPDQKRMVAAILALCDRLGLETVAEGVETPGEHATVAQLGCHHVQGFGIARPMAVEESFGWIKRHEAALSARANFGRVPR